ncbi:MAG: substrate-binding domain-containing protein [Inquilinaceae bacterium]
MILRCVLAAILTLGLSGTAAGTETMRMAVTTSFANSGLAEVLLPEIEKDTGITVELLIVGTGQALRLGEAGDVDAVLVHARAAEDAFVAAGHATHRREIMYNDFVIVGPADDPAGAGKADTAVAAFAAIEAVEAPFVSRGDDSGTHQAELALWETAEIEPVGDWYRPVGAGMGAALNTASGMNAYILSDRATWLAFENNADLALVFAGDPVLFNQYAYLPVNPEKGDFIKAEAAAMLEDWLTSERAQVLIDGFTVSGEQVFTFNASSMM